MIDAILEWLTEYESALSAIAALIVIGTLAATAGRQWLTSNRGAGASGQAGAASSGSAPAAGSLNPVTDRPSIAVLPFENTSGDPANEAAADGLTTEIISGLSANPHLFVIARNSCFSYKGRRVDVRDVARELGVRYVLEGTVQARNNRVRVSAQLADATTGAMTWSQRFDVPLDDLFELDDVVTAAIVAALIPELRRAEAKRAQENPVDLDAWARVNAIWLELQSNLSNTDIARDAVRKLEEIISEEPDFALAYGVLSHAYSLSFSVGTESTDETRELQAKTQAAIDKAVDLDPDDPAIRHLAGAALSNFRLSDDARRSYEKALDLNPDYAPALGSLGVSVLFQGETDKAIELMERALRLSPREPHAYHWQSHLALALTIKGDADRALPLVLEATSRRATLMGRVALLLAHALLGNDQEAETAAADLRNSMPDTLPTAALDELMGDLVKEDARRQELINLLQPHLDRHR